MEKEQSGVAGRIGNELEQIEMKPRLAYLQGMQVSLSKMEFKASDMLIKL